MVEIVECISSRGWLHEMDSRAWNREKPNPKPNMAYNDAFGWLFPEAAYNTAENLRHINDRVYVLFLEILWDSDKTLFDISVNTGQICMNFEADTPQKILKYAHLTKSSDKKLI